MRILKWPGCTHVQITCSTSGSYHVQHAMSYVVRIDSTAVYFYRIEMTVILALFRWLKHLTDDGGEETRVPEQKA